MTEKEVRPSSRAGADAISTVSESKRKLQADKDANRRIKKAKTSLRCHTVINDAEICRYLHSENEVQIKKFIWEAMNKNHVQVERKKPVKAKKVCPAKELVKIDTQEDYRKRLSSRINFDVLEKLNEEQDNHNLEGDEGENLDSNYINNDMQRYTKTVSAAGCSSRETECYDEHEIGSEHNEELDTNNEHYEDEDQGFEEEEDYFFNDY